MSEDEFIPRAIPRVRVALYGPSGSGKSKFLNTLIRRNVPEEKTTTEPEIIEITRAYKRRTVMGTLETVTNYKLVLIDVPGREELEKQRTEAVKKAVIWLFFYDSTNPASANELYNMIKSELEKKEILKSAIAMAVVGTKGDINPNPEAVKIGDDIAKYLSKVVSYYGYEIPHFIISCLSSEDVDLTFFCVERLNFELKLPDDIVGQLKKRSEQYIIKTSELAVAVSEPIKVEKAEVLVGTKELEAPEIVEKIEEISLPPLPEIPKEAEKVFGKPEEEGKIFEAAKEIVETTGIPETEVPEKIPSIEELSITEEIISVAETKSPQILASPEDSSWVMASNIQASIGYDSKVYIVDAKPDKLLVARNIRGDKLDIDEEEMIKKLLGVISVVDEDVGILKAMLVLSKEMCVTIRGEKILIIKINSALAREIYSALTKLGRSEKWARIELGMPSKPSLSIEQTKNQSLRKLVDNIQQKLKSDECFVLIVEGEKAEFAYAGVVRDPEKQREFLLKLYSVNRTVSEVFPDYKLLVVVGSRSIVVFRGSKGILVLISKEAPSSELMDFISA
ncbi:MAG: GTPase domain-containing protein [Candidatus Korarchaeota archaeon]